MKILWQCIEKPCHNLFRLAENVVLVEHRICTNHPLYNNQKRIAMVVNINSTVSGQLCHANPLPVYELQGSV